MGLLTDSFLMDTIFFLIVIVYLVYIIFTKDYYHWKKLGIYHLKPSFPWGNMYSLLVKRKPRFLALQELYKEMKARGQPYGGFYHLNVPELLVVDPALLKHILISDFSAFQDRGMNNLDTQKEPIIRKCTTFYLVRYDNRLIYSYRENFWAWNST